MKLLPEDILYEVFEHAVQQDPKLQPLHISHCCRLWRMMALRTPALWTQILIDQPQKDLCRLNIWLKRSNQKLLDIYVWRFRSNHQLSNWESYLDNCFRSLMHHRNRWRTLVLRDYPSRMLERRLLSDSYLPELTTLSVGMEPDQAHAIEWGVLKFRAPKLQTLELAGLVVEYSLDRWIPPLVEHKLTSLTIGSHEKASLTLNNYLGLLRRCLFLERLTIEVELVQLRTSYDPPSSLIVEAPNLNSIILASTINTTRRPYIVCLQAPNLTHLGCSVPFEFVPYICSLPAFPFPSLENISLVADDYYLTPYRILESNGLAAFLAQLLDLRHLSLSDVDFDASENIPFPFMSALCTSCPRLEKLSLSNCWGIRMVEWLQILTKARRQCANRVQHIKFLEVDCHFYKPTVEQKTWLIANIDAVQFDNE